jgi:hypothetical protein
MREFTDEFDRPFHRRLGRPMKDMTKANDILLKGGHDGFVCEGSLDNITAVIRDGEVKSINSILGLKEAV